MWILEWLPAEVFYLLLFAGILATVAGFFLGMIPLIGRYKIPIQILGIMMMAAGLYMVGRMANEEKWQARVRDMEAKVAEANERAANVSAQVITKFVTRREVVRERGEQIITYVDREVVKYDNKCEIPPVVVQVHDAAARNQPVPQMTEAPITPASPPADPPATPDTPVNTSIHNSSAIRMPRKTP